MTTRNTPLLVQIVGALDGLLTDRETALARLEEHFQERYVLDAGGVEYIDSAATDLRLRMSREECPPVLDYIALKGMVGITVDHVETAINELLGEDRFIEPEQYPPSGRQNKRQRKVFE